MKSVRRAVQTSVVEVKAAQDKLFDDIEVDFSCVDLLIELWWELGRLHQLLVNRARHSDEGRTQSWWLLLSFFVSGVRRRKAVKPRVSNSRRKSSAMKKLYLSISLYINSCFCNDFLSNPCNSSEES